MEFMKFWMKNYPDVITGWNTKFFDLPYLCNRIKLLTDEKVVRRFALEFSRHGRDSCKR